MTRPCVLVFALAFPLFGAACDREEDEDHLLIVQNSGVQRVDVLLLHYYDILEQRTLDPSEEVATGLTEGILKDHPTLWVCTNPGGHELVSLTLRRSLFTGPGQSLRVTVYP